MVPASTSMSGLTTVSPTVTVVAAGSMGVPAAGLANCTTASRVPPAEALALTVWSRGFVQSPTRRARFSVPSDHLV